MVFHRGPNADLKALQLSVRRSQWIFAPMIWKCTWLFLLSFPVPRFARIRYNDRKDQVDGLFWNWSTLELFSKKSAHWVKVWESTSTFWQFSGALNLATLALRNHVHCLRCPFIWFLVVENPNQSLWSRIHFLSCSFLGWRAPKLITRISRCWGPDQSRKTKETVTRI